MYQEISLKNRRWFIFVTDVSYFICDGFIAVLLALLHLLKIFE